MGQNRATGSEQKRSRAQCLTKLHVVKYCMELNKGGSLTSSNRAGGEFGIDTTTN